MVETVGGDRVAFGKGVQGRILYDLHRVGVGVKPICLAVGNVGLVLTWNILI